ncbi:sodium/bile acid cotransporter 7 [Crenobacter luteus]|uniref:bile acid:sodium symporter family protein n=1 Tax=Crenobacter luteus TaxID=1452487 RepID=UPI0010DFCC83|nr:bile acid:sodium symporter family protein [Crenobacter luteus]TCP12644.1 sodium/bile acid cotransporter 7 [Crenobacter luteus]
MQWLKKLGLDGFMLALIGAVALSAVWPELGRSGGLVKIEYFTGYGVAVVFLLYGLTLSPQKLREGLFNWRLHATVQLSTFLLFPLLGLALVSALGGVLVPALALGFFFLAALPSTVSSSVAMTSIAKGNVPGAIFNASLSSLIGVFLTPLWVNAYLKASGVAFDLWPVILKVVMLVLLPIALGQLLRPLLIKWLTRHAALTRLLDRATILAIVLNSFSDSVAEGVWAEHGASTIALIAGLSVGLFVLVYVLMQWACRRLGFDRGDTIACTFCGSKKSLAAGVPMAKVMFGANPALGLIIAPIMLYHFLQLVMVSYLARRLGEQGGAP